VGASETLAQRRQQLDGFIYAPFRIHDLLESVLRHELAEGIALHATDITAVEPRELFVSEDFSSADGRFARPAAVPVAGRTWRISFVSLPAFGITRVIGWPFISWLAGWRSAG